MNVDVDEQVQMVVARMESVKAGVAAAAEGLADVARSRLERLPRVRTGASQVEVVHGRVDTYVDLVDKAALFIELGRGGRERADGTVSGGMQGLRILRGAVEESAGDR